MSKYLFMGPVLQWISQGKFFRKAFVVALYVLTIGFIVTVLVSWTILWKFISGAHTTVIIGVILYQLLFIVAVYMVVHTLLFRVREINNLADSEFTVIPITSISLRLVGEIYACYGAVTSLAGGILIWLAGPLAFYILEQSMTVLPNFGGNGGFQGGISFIVMGWVVTFAVLVAFYFLAELIMVMVDIARDVKLTRQIAEKYDRK